jgi:hypothetical protein
MSRRNKAKRARRSTNRMQSPTSATAAKPKPAATANPTSAPGASGLNMSNHSLESSPPTATATPAPDPDTLPDDMGFFETRRPHDSYEQTTIDLIEESVIDVQAYFPNPSLIERCAIRNLSNAATRLARFLSYELALDDDSEYAEPELLRSIAAAQRDYWRALRYLERRLDLRCRLIDQPPKTAGHKTRFKTDQEYAAARTEIGAQVPENEELPDTEPDFDREFDSDPDHEGSNRAQTPGKTQLPFESMLPWSSLLDIDHGLRSNPEDGFPLYEPRPWLTPAESSV